MRYDWMDEFLLKKRSVTKDFQPVWNWVRYHIGGKMFAALCLDDKGQPYYINLKVDPAEGAFLRDQYEDIIPGYYSDKRNWISVKTNGTVPDELLKYLLDKACGLMLKGFSKKKRYATCADCEELPCTLWKELRDPQLSEKEFNQSIEKRIQNLREI